MEYIKAAVALIFFLPAGLAWSDERIDFNRDIRPLLSQHCYTCHGPDEEARQAGLRLDRFEQGLDLAVERGDPENSELVDRIADTDPDFRMPPPQHGRALTESEVERIRNWITAGAPYTRHWSYQKPVRPRIEAVDEGWAINDIDRLILDKMQSKGLHPTAAAKKEVIARRVAIDLTGLPPEEGEVQTFLNDDSTSAYESLVDGLLAKPTFGERWAAMWLDHARYADTMGYAEDRPRTIWSFRDYVIRSFNENKPFDQFTIEQLAGDLLPHATEEQLVATAFHRNTLTNTEGGTIDEEFRSAAVVDRVNTTMAVWMGTTMACAQCHTHKYDPITQKEYFQFYAFFNNTADNDQPNEQPILPIYSADSRQRRQLVQDKINDCQKRREAWNRLGDDERRQQLTSMLQNWERNLLEDDGGSQKSSFVRVELPGKNRILSLAEVEVVVAGENIAANGDPSQSSTDFGGSADRAIDGNTNGHYSVANSVTHTELQVSPWWELRLATPEMVERIVVWHRTDGQLYRRSNGLIVSLLDENRKTIWSTSIEKVGAPSDSMTTGSIPRKILAIVRNSNRSDEESQSLRDYFETQLGPLTMLDRELAQLQSELDSIAPATTVPIMQELPPQKRRVTRIHHRGSYLAPGDEVERGTPSAFHSFDFDQKNRLTLAKWLVSRDNPLIARVTVNRFWRQFFGRGIVRSLEEFGAQGDLPSHPELLDFLACEFMDSGWDVKALLKQMVMSATYRQSSRAAEDHWKIDPENIWLARGPRLRLTAEMVRDQALAAARLLHLKMYGPPVQPPQPKLGLKMAFRNESADWNNDTGPNRYRRSIYTRWQRSSPYPSLATFDVSNREVCELGRIPTNTPLQALVTLNDPVFVEAAQGMARQVVGMEDVPAAASILFRSVLVRNPVDAEIQVLENLFHESREHFERDHVSARKLGVDPLHSTDKSVDVVRLAAWTTVANVILNLDEALMKR